MKRHSLLLHLLKPGVFRVWCRPKDPPLDLGVTTLPSKVTCAACLTAYRLSKGGKRFRVAHVSQARWPDGGKV